MTPGDTIRRHIGTDHTGDLIDFAHWSPRQRQRQRDARRSGGGAVLRPPPSCRATDCAGHLPQRLARAGAARLRHGDRRARVRRGEGVAQTKEWPGEHVARLDGELGARAARRRPGVRHLAPDERYAYVLLLVSIIVVDVVARRRRPGDGPRVPLLAALELGLYSVARLEAHHLSWKRRDAKRVDELHAEALGRREAPVGDRRHVRDAGRARELAAPARQDVLLGVRHERVLSAARRSPSGGRSAYI